MGDLISTENPDTLVMDANKNVTATFGEIPASSFVLTLSTIGSGSIALSPPGGVYDPGTVVAVTAIPDSGFEFSAWIGDLSGTVNPTNHYDGFS